MYYENKTIISGASNSLSLMNNKMPCIYWCWRVQLFDVANKFLRGQNLEDFWSTYWATLLLTITLLNFSQKHHAFWCSIQCYNFNHFLFRIQDLTGYLYIWKTRKFILSWQEMYEAILTDWCLHQAINHMYNFSYYVISSHCFQCASAIQVNIKRWKLSNYLWNFLNVIFLISNF